MTQSTVSKEVTKSFDNTSPTAGATPCCKNVKARLEKARFVPSAGEMHRVGEPEIKEINPEGGITERAIKFTQRVKIPGTITVKVVCICEDDGRTLSSKEVVMKVAGPTVPLSYKFKALKLPLAWAIGPLTVLRDLKEIDKIIAAAAGGDENARQALQQLGGEELNKQIGEAEKKAHDYCKNANKCAGS